MPAKPLNSLASKNTLALTKEAWLESYKNAPNWPLHTWLQFQHPASGSIQDALRVLHEVQTHFNIQDEKIQQTMFDWMLAFKEFDHSTLNSWRAWAELFDSTPGWSTKQHAFIIGSCSKTKIFVEPQHFEDMWLVEQRLGSYWNSIRSRVQRQTAMSDGQWETYNTLRREQQSGKLLEHPSAIRWNDFELLPRLPSSWQKTLQPLYRNWIEGLAENTMWTKMTMQNWLNALDDNGMDASTVAFPLFERANDYECWSIPSSWNSGDAEQTLRRITYLDRASKLFLQENNNQKQPVGYTHPKHSRTREYPASVNCWIQTQCLEHTEAWSLKQRQDLLPLFMVSLSVHDYEYMVKHTTVHATFMKWFPEYSDKLVSLRETMDGLDLDYRETTQNWRGEVIKKYTGETARAEMAHYAELLGHVMQPVVFGVGEDIGHLFETENLDILGL